MNLKWKIKKNKQQGKTGSKENSEEKWVEIVDLFFE